VSNCGLPDSLTRRSLQRFCIGSASRRDRFVAFAAYRLQNPASRAYRAVLGKTIHLTLRESLSRFSRLFFDLMNPTNEQPGASGKLAHSLIGMERSINVELLS
jgi:hypothetical protein